MKGFNKALLGMICLIIVIPSGIGQFKTLEFTQTFRDDSICLDLDNFMYAPVLVKMTYKLDFKDGIRGPDEIVIGPKSSFKDLIAISASLVKDTSDFSWSDFLDAKASLGDPYDSDHNDSINYRLPFNKGKSYKILQSWNGRFSHRSTESRYAVDFAMPEGDTICAARSGVVIHSEDRFTENGGIELKDKANQIVILHEDGTMGFYVHLLHNGVLVQPGDSIRSGQVIGLSGNTGYSTEPHLHFVVREAPDKSVLIYFQGFKRKKLKKGLKVHH